MRIGFDHCYQKIEHAREYTALGERGFTLNATVVEHPGKLMCRFLYFNQRSAVAEGLGGQYLEFTEVTDPEALARISPAGASPGRLMEPGFSFRCDQDLKQLFRKIRTPLAASAPVFAHQNYKWTEDSEQRLPGWNFLMFDEPLVEHINVWCTEYEPDPDRKPPPARFLHDNTADRILGFVWNLDAAALGRVAELAQATVRDGRIELADGLTIYSTGARELPAEVFGTSKSSPFAAVILACTDWATFAERGRPDSVFAFGGRRAGLIRFPDHGWDIVVVDDPDAALTT